MNASTISSQLFCLLPLATFLTGVYSQPTTAASLTPAQRCQNLPQTLYGSLNITATYYSAGQGITLPNVPGCGLDPSVILVFPAMTNLCRVESTIATSNRSQIKLEAWLPDPDAWNGRFLGTGNGGIGGCFSYDTLVWGSGNSHMATVNTNNGHEGFTAIDMMNNADVLADFVWRSMKVEHDVGVTITQAYYNTMPKKKYYGGCSTGGRQGMYIAQNFPDLYDGIIAGSPAINMQNFVSQQMYLTIKDGFKSNVSESKLIVGLGDLPLISEAVLKECDELDGVKNGIIDQPDKCNFDPHKLLCNATQLAAGNTTGICLTLPQVEVVKTIFTPLYGAHGEILSSRLDPGMTASTPWIFNGQGFTIALDIFRHLIYNDSTYNLDDFSIKDIEFAKTVNPGGWSTYNPNLSKLKTSGTKMLSYHGTADGVIPSGNTKRYYHMVAKTMHESPDAYWKHFVIPGMEHCFMSTTTGSAAWNFGQMHAQPKGIPNDRKYNILWSLVDWVEKGISPQGIIGTKFVNDTADLGIEAQRKYCPYPKRSVLKSGKDPKKADSWKCVH